jgi:hypothetical protein
MKIWEEWEERKNSSKGDNPLKSRRVSLGIMRKHPVSSIISTNPVCVNICCSGAEPWQSLEDRAKVEGQRSVDRGP